MDNEAVIPLPTVDNVYEVPLILEDAGLGNFIVRTFGFTDHTRDLTAWADMVEHMKSLPGRVPIAVVGKYAEYPDSYISVREALRHAGVTHDRGVEIEWVHSEDVERLGPDSLLANACGIVVPGGFGRRGVEGMVETARYARQHQVPYLGLCLGMQVMIVEWARNVLGLPQANSSELDPDTPDPVIHIMPDQRDVTTMGGTMRLGWYPCRPVANTRTYDAYQSEEVMERHRHRFEVNNAYRENLEESGLIIGGLSPDGSLVETAEVRDHKFMVGVQFHPEFQSRPNRPHPLFRDFVGAAKDTIREGSQRPCHWRRRCNRPGISLIATISEHHLSRT